MAILGWEGYVILCRDYPEPASISSDQLTLSSSGWVLDLEEADWLPGDRVTLTHPDGLPLALLSDGPASNSFYAVYGPELPVLGRWSEHRAGGDGGPFYHGNDADPFYGGVETVQTEATVFIHVDGLDRVSFYTDELAAITGGKAHRIDIPVTVFQDVRMAGAWREGDGWKQQCDLTQWSFETDPTNLDTTAIGEDFGSYARSLVRGAGAFAAWMSSEHVDPAQCSPSSRIAKLSLLRGRGAKALARFQITDGSADRCSPETPLFYETEILMGRSTLTVGLDQPDSLSAEFVATGEIRLTASA